MQLYDRGIRRRLAPMLGDRRRLELAYSLMFSLPGTPVLYYGDEIGMGDDLTLPERDSVRTPMQWSSDRNAGFSTADKLVAPVVATGPYGYENVNVERQRRDPDSLLRWMTRLIRLRIECPEIGWGDWKLVATRSPHVLALLYRWRGTAVLCLHNFDEQPHEVTLRARGGGRRPPRRSDRRRPLARQPGRRAPALARRLRLPLVRPRPARRGAAAPLRRIAAAGARQRFGTLCYSGLVSDLGQTGFRGKQTKRAMGLEPTTLSLGS